MPRRSPLLAVALLLVCVATTWCATAQAGSVHHTYMGSLRAPRAPRAPVVDDAVGTGGGSGQLQQAMQEVGNVAGIRAIQASRIVALKTGIDLVTPYPNPVQVTVDNTNDCPLAGSDVEQAGMFFALMAGDLSAALSAALGEGGDVTQYADIMEVGSDSAHFQECAWRWRWRWWWWW